MKCGGFRVSYRSDERLFDTWVPVAGVLVLLAGLALVPRFATTYWLDVLNRIGIAVIGALGLNILMYEPQGLARIWVRVKGYWTLWPYSY